MRGDAGGERERVVKSRLKVIVLAVGLCIIFAMPVLINPNNTPLHMMPNISGGIVENENVDFNAFADSSENAPDEEPSLASSSLDEDGVDAVLVEPVIWKDFG